MSPNPESLKALKQEVLQILGKFLHPQELVIERKRDKTLVTNIDIHVSQAVKAWAQRSGMGMEDGEGIEFFSEEEHQALRFPALILDPIDGTKQLILKNPECALSMAYMHGPSLLDERNWGYIFNPFTQLEMDSWSLFHGMKKSHSIDRRKRGRLCALISSSEWEKGLTRKVESRFNWVKSGSIAQKLALLSAGLGDFIVSYRPKSLWDVAAGSIIAQKRSLVLYSQGKRVELLDQELFHPPLVWCYPEDWEHILFQI